MTVRYSDCLRGLMDNASFLRILSVFGAGAAPTDRCAAIVIDIDRAESINAQLGDPTGDELMRMVLKRCDAALPLQALAGRLRPNAIGLLMFSQISDEEVDTVCTAVHDALRATTAGHGEEISLGASIGAAFTNMRCPAIRALQHAEHAAQRVRANGGDATFMARQSGAFPALEFAAVAA